MVDLFVVVVAPHSLCNPKLKYRHCDRVAREAAIDLYQKLPYDGKLFLSNVYREKLDLNRSPSRKSPFRHELSKYIGTVSDGVQKMYVLDVHSFPEGEYQDRQIAIVNNDMKRNLCAKRLFHYLQDDGFDVEYFEGTDVNDIHIEALKHGHPSVLIEFNENLTPNQIQDLTQSITNWLRDEYQLVNS